MVLGVKADQSGVIAASVERRTLSLSASLVFVDDTSLFTAGSEGQAYNNIADCMLQFCEMTKKLKLKQET